MTFLKAFFTFILDIMWTMLAENTRLFLSCFNHKYYLITK